MAKYSYEFKLQVVQAYLDFYFVRFVQLTESQTQQE